MKKLVHTPDGVRDIYGEEFQRKLTLEKKVKDVIRLYGFDDIQTPTFEYFDVFSKEIGTTPSKDLYKFFDKDGNTLVLRPDFTPSIARCVAKYFDEETKPIRLTYSGNTFINNSALQGKLKEVTEVGCELMNDDSAEADAELINLVIDCLLASGLKEFQLVLGHIGFFKGLCEAAGIRDEDELTLREAISSKNSFMAGEMLKEFNCSPELTEQFKYAIDLTGDPSEVFELKDRITNKRSNDAILRLEKVYELLKLYGHEKFISIDLGILSKFNYYTGIIFKGYTYGIGDVLIKGGRYDRLLESFGSSKPAIGFMIVIDDLMMALSRQKIEVNTGYEKVVVTYNDQNYADKLKEIIELRKEGKAVVPVRE
ncbi:MAG: ATP phosphoribosyltransferase regulatory subunit [Lachnospiraceae bacterium]|nr:ATP phosphoribosyltransferase regulatory subunit [Lachnospiraceae bacterium]